jgi:hypothetical protein
VDKTELENAKGIKDIKVKDFPTLKNIKKI